MPAAEIGVPAKSNAAVHQSPTRSAWTEAFSSMASSTWASGAESPPAGVAALATSPLPTNREGDGEHPTPRASVHERSAEQRADDETRPRPGGPSADGLTLARLRKVGDDESERARDEQGACDALKPACNDEDPACRSEGAEQRRRPKSDQGSRKHSLSVKNIGKGASNKHERAERQQVRVDDPLLSREPAAKVVADGGQGHIDDCPIQKHDG